MKNTLGFISTVGFIVSMVLLLAANGMTHDGHDPQDWLMLTIFILFIASGISYLLLKLIYRKHTGK